MDRHQDFHRDCRSGEYGSTAPPGAVGGQTEASREFVPEPAAPAGELDSLTIYSREIGRSEPPCRCARASACKPGSAGFRCLGPEARGGVGCALVIGHLRLVVALARRYRRLNLPLEDLIQEGNLGLVVATRCFDPERHGRFSAHAARYIRQAICRALSRKARMIRIPFGQLALRRRAATVGAELEQRYRNDACGGGPLHEHRLEDDAAEIGVEPDELRENRRLVPDVESLDAPAAPGLPPGSSRSERLPDGRAPDPGDAAAGSEELGHLREAVSHLPDRLRRIMELRYGFDGGEESTFAEIGKALGLTAPRIHQLHGKALGMLRADPHFHHALQ